MSACLALPASVIASKLLSETQRDIKWPAPAPEDDFWYQPIRSNKGCLTLNEVRALEAEEIAPIFNVHMMPWHDDENHPFAGIAKKLERADESFLNLHNEIDWIDPRFT